MSEKCPKCGAEGVSHISICGVSGLHYPCGYEILVNGRWKHGTDCLCRQLAAKAAEIARLQGEAGYALGFFRNDKGRWRLTAVVQVRNVLVKIASTPETADAAFGVDAAPPAEPTSREGENG